MAELLCPYCYEPITRNAVAFRCINPDRSRCKSVVDEPLARYQRRPATMPPLSLPVVFSAVRGSSRISGIPQSGKCQGCGYESSKMVCPHCHNELPFQFGQLQDCSIALMGAKSSGKSNYIGVVVHELKARVCSAFNGSLTTCDDQTSKRYDEGYYRPLFKEHQVLPETISGRANFEVRYPLAYRLDITKKRIVLAQRKLVGLTFFDTAGEDLANQETVTTEARYIAKSNGLIMLLDPLQLSGVREQLQGRVQLPVVNDQERILERATQLIRQDQKLKPKQKIKTPLAIAFSKFDALRPLITHPELLRQGDHGGHLNLDDVDQVHELVRAYVERWAGSHLTSFLKDHYEHWRFFSLSALGSPPVGMELPHGVNPFRVEDPLLWLLYMNGVVQGQRARRAAS